jgi:hypothetical protein
MVKVSDPDNWDDQKTIEVALVMVSQPDNTFLIKLIADSGWKTGLEYEQVCSFEQDAQQVYAKLKTFLYDAMPKKISRNWCLTHGILLNK